MQRLDRLFFAIIYIIKYCFFFIVALSLKLLSYIYHFEFYGIKASRIGHLSVEIEVALQTFYEARKTRSRLIFFFVDLQQNEVANSFLYKKWKQVLTIGPSRLLGRITEIQGYFPFLKYNILNCESLSVDYRVLDRSKPSISFTESELIQGRQLLTLLGIKEDSKFVCLAARDSEYLRKSFPDYDFSYHDYRDTNIEDFQDMCHFLAQKGYHVLRMGKFVSSTLVCHDEKVIDYANSNLQSDFADVFLFAHCEFIISTSTGMDRLGVLFRKPIGLVNLPLPQEGEFLGDTLKLVMYKDVIDSTSKERLSVFDSRPFQARRSPHVIDDFLSLGIEYRCNSPQELTSFSQEMIMLLQSKACDLMNLEIYEDRYLNMGFQRMDISLRSFRISPSWLLSRIN